MKPRNRRQCCIIGECLLFQAVERTNQRIINNFAAGAARVADQYIKTAERLTEQFLNNKLGKQIPPTFGIQAQKKELVAFHKKEWDQSPSSISHTEPKRCFSFNKSHMKDEQKFVIPKPSSKKKMTEAQELQESLTKLDLEDREDFVEKEDKLDEADLEYLKGKTVMELIHESQMKIEAKKETMKELMDKEEPFSDSSYPLTEHSSNQSSNQYDYQQYFLEEFQNLKPSQTYKSVPNLSSLSSQSFSGFEAKKIMFSPKKSKETAKRLYVRDKKIPRWAQDMEKVKQQVLKQKKDPHLDPQQIFGVCIVQKLDTNVIFESKEPYVRGSSAKWNRNPLNLLQ